MTTANCLGETREDERPSDLDCPALKPLLSRRYEDAEWRKTRITTLTTISRSTAGCRARNVAPLWAFKKAQFADRVRERCGRRYAERGVVGSEGGSGYSVVSTQRGRRSVREREEGPGEATIWTRG